METVCSGDNCPRRWVCRRADVVPMLANIIDYRCWEDGNYAMFERNDRSEAALVRYEIGTITTLLQRLTSLEMSREFIAEEGPHVSP